MKEIDIQNVILEYLSYQKIYAWRNNNAAVYSQKRQTYLTPTKWSIKGVADILGILPDGRLLAIEVKKPTGRATTEQKEFLTNINKNGGVGFVAKSLDDVKKVIPPRRY